jgi:hypothetical protein
MRRILSTVDRVRTEALAQHLYGQHDDQAWIIKVTDQLYRGAVEQELRRLCALLPETDHPHVNVESLVGSQVGKALGEIYSARHRFQSDPEMTAFLSTLLHVRFDRCVSCNWPVPSLSPDVHLHRLDGTPTSLHALLGHVLLCPTSRMVVFSGSFT